MLNACGKFPQARGDEPDPALALSGVSGDGRQLLSLLLDVDDNRRVSVEDALKQPWFSEVRASLRSCA